MAPQQHAPAAATAADQQPATLPNPGRTGGGGGKDVEAVSMMTVVPATKSHSTKPNRHHRAGGGGAVAALKPAGSKILRNIAQAKHTKRFPHTDALAGPFDNISTKETNALRKRRRFLRALRRHRNALKRQRSSPNITNRTGGGGGGGGGGRVFPNIEAASSGTTLPPGSIGPSPSGTTLMPLFNNATAAAGGAPVERVQVFVRLRPSTEFANANFYIAPNSNNLEVFRMRGDRRKKQNNRERKNDNFRRNNPNNFKQNLLASVDANQQQSLFGKPTTMPMQVENDAFANHNDVTAQHDPSKKVFNWRFSFDGIIHDMYTHASNSLASLAQQQTQLRTFELVAKPLVQAALRGTSGVMLSCGHAKTGKSYSLVGNLNSYDFRGIIPRTLQYLFQQLQTSQQQARIYLQYYDVYGDHLVDLLSPSPVPVKQHNMTLRKLQNLLYVYEMNLQQIAREEDALKIFMIGESFRQMCRQQQRRRSRKRQPSVTKTAVQQNHDENVNEISRSHTIFTIYIEQQRPVVPAQPPQVQRANNTAATPQSAQGTVQPPPASGAQQQQVTAPATNTVVENNATAVIDDRIVCSKICFVELASPHRLPKHSYVDPHRRTEISEVNKSLSFLEHSILMLSESQPLSPPQPTTTTTPAQPPQPAPLREQPVTLPPATTTKQSVIQQRPATAAGAVSAALPTATTAAVTVNTHQKQQQQQQKPVHNLPQPQQRIPSRACKLTYALKDLLNTKTYCVVLAHICGQRSKLNETLATLHFASRTKLVPICPMRTRRIDRRRRMRKLEAEVDQLTKDLRMAALLQQPLPLQPNDPSLHLVDDDPTAPPLTAEESARLKREVNEFLKGNPSRLDSPTFRSSFKQMRIMFAYMQRAIRNGFLQQQQTITAQNQQQLQQQQQQLLAAAASPLEASSTNSTVMEAAPAATGKDSGGTHAAETRRERRAKAEKGEKGQQQALSVSEVERLHDKAPSPSTTSRDAHGDRPTAGSSNPAPHSAAANDDDASVADDGDDANVSAKPAPTNAKQRLAVSGKDNPAKLSSDVQSVGGASTTSSNAGKQQQAAQQAALQTASGRKANQPAASGRKGTTASAAAAHNASAKEIQAAAAAAAAAAASSAAGGGEAAGGKTASAHVTGGDAGALGTGGGGSEASSDDDHKLQRASTAEGGGGARPDGDLTAGGGPMSGGGNSGNEVPTKSDAYHIFIRFTPHGTLIYQTLVQNKKVVHEKEERIKENSANITACKNRIRSIQKRLRLCERVWKADKKQKVLSAEQATEKPPATDTSKKTTNPLAAKKPNDTVTDGCILVEQRDYDDVRLLIGLQRELSEKKELLDRLKREFHAAIDFVSRTRLFLMRQFVEWYDTTYGKAAESADKNRIASPAAVITGNSTGVSAGGGLPQPPGSATGALPPPAPPAAVANVYDTSEHAALERDPMAAAFFQARLVAEKWSEAQALSNKWSKIDGHDTSAAVHHHQISANNAVWK